MEHPTSGFLKEELEGMSQHRDLHTLISHRSFYFHLGLYQGQIFATPVYDIETQKTGMEDYERCIMGEMLDNTWPGLE